MSPCKSREQAAKQIWLLYFNRVLLEKGLLNEREYNRMKLKIQHMTRKSEP